MKHWNWESKRVIITGGASFIGSHLVEAIYNKGAKVIVIDDLSRVPCRRETSSILNRCCTFFKEDVRSKYARNLFSGVDVVFHLAAKHGGRYYIENNESSIKENFEIDESVIQTAINNKVKRFSFASSACVYPLSIQTGKPHRLLKEEEAGNIDDADHEYGRAKLSAEKMLRKLISENKIEGSICRFFTVYGPGSPEDHSITATIAKVLSGITSVRVWGNGKQIRSWIYVSDVIEGFLKSSEISIDGSPINLGDTRKIDLDHLTSLIIKICNKKMRIEHDDSMPTGPLYRVPDIKKANKILSWKPTVKLEDGLIKTIDWYKLERNNILDSKILEDLLLGPKKEASH